MLRILFLLLLIFLSANADSLAKTIKLCEGKITDVGGADKNYPDNYLDTLTYCSASGGNLAIKFDYFDLSNGDTLWVYAGENVSSPLIGVYVHSSTVEMIENSGCVTFRFKSDGKDNARGWQATVSCPDQLSNPSEKVYSMSSGVRYLCEGVFMDDGGTGNYGLNRRTQTFVSNNGERLSVSIQEFSVNFNNDGHWLRVYDGPSNRYPLIGAYNDARYPPKKITASGTTLTFDFDATNNWAANRSGWVMNFSCEGATLPILSTEKNEVIASCNGVWYDTGGASANYKANSQYTQTFKAQSGYLQCLFNNADFQIGKGDTLKVYDGQNVSAPLKAIFIKDSYIEPIYASGSYLTFDFKADANEEGRGWQAFFTCLDQNDTTTPTFAMSAGLRSVCNAIFTDDGGASGDYQPVKRSQTFMGNVTGRLRVDVIDFDVNFNNDGHWLRIYDGFDDKATLIGSYNSANYPPKQIESTGQALTFVFDGTNSWARTRAGWKFKFSCTDGEPLQIINRIKNPVCAGEEVSVSVQTNRTLDTDNQFQLQMSDETGSFTNPTDLGSVKSNTSFVTKITIPPNTPSGKNYRIRITTSPVTYNSSDLADPFEVMALPVVPNIEISGDTLFCDKVKLSFTPQNEFTYRWLKNGQPTDSTGQTLTVDSEGIYGLQVTSKCGVKESDRGIRLIKISKPVAFSISSENAKIDLCPGDSIKLSVSQTAEYQQFIWKLNEKSVGTGNEIYIRESGQYSCIAMNACGEIPSTNMIEIKSITIGKIEKQKDRLIAPEGESYRWLNEDFSPISNQTDRTFIPKVSGTYRVEVMIKGCKLLSDTVHFVLPDGIHEINSSESKIIVYADENHKGLFYIKGCLLPDYQIYLYDVSARKITPPTGYVDNIAIIDLSTFAHSPYLLKIEQKGGESVFTTKILW